MPGFQPGILGFNVQVSKNSSVNLANAAPSHGGSYAPKMVRGFKKLPAAQQKTIRRAFSKFSREAVESLIESDHSLVVRKGKPGMLAGLYDGKDKLITIYADPDCEEAEHTIIHEMVHALDRVKFTKDRGLVSRLVTPERERDHSRHDSELQKLHTDYSQRTLPHFGQRVADAVDLSQGKGDIAVGARHYNWKHKDGVLELKESSPAALRYFEFAGDAIKKGIVCGLGAAFGCMIGFGGAPLLGAAVALPLATYAIGHLKSAAKSIANERALNGYKDSQVEVSGRKMTFQLNQELTEDQKMTSSYATIERQQEEYLAESMTHFLRSPESRESLKKRDPLMHDYCESWNIAP